FVIGGTPLSEKWEIAGVLDQGIPDPEIRVIDPLTGLVAAQLQVQHTEEIAIQTKAGDDIVNVNWVAARMSDLTLLRVDLAEDEDVLNVMLFPPPDDGLPVEQEVQIARLQLISGSGSDQVNFNHFGGSWFDLSFTADTGKGDDGVSALLGPPPDDSLPGPEGIRRLHFDVDTGKGDDFTSLKNQTNSEFFDVFFDADFKGGDDLFEGSGQIQRAELLPGPGFDTARVTRNIISFVSAFEEIEIND
ncbi:MAG TPA: hypothetical protein VLH08_11025, partial [Acidobacteriota bacterium]|nr:hypothetical protein [Acidobacteriota bacterium]